MTSQALDCPVKIDFEGMDGVERLFPGIADELLLERIDPVAERFQSATK